MAKLLLFNKPFKVMCQFTDEQGRKTLKDYINIPKIYVAGRLDFDSEGLLLLTDDGMLQHKISDPKNKMPKTYWVQVEGTPDTDAIARLTKGVKLKDGMTRPAIVSEMDEPLDLWTRQPPIRIRQNIPTSWMSITLREGKNRQVRRMTAAVGLPTLRLIRYSIGEWSLDDLPTGEYSLHQIAAVKR